MGRQAGLANWGLVSTPSPYERHVELPSVFNLRDLGGYTGADGRSVAWRRIFRADGLQRLARADLGRLRELGLRTVVDLRRPDEVELGRLEADGVAYHHHSLQPIDWLVDGYDESVGVERYLADRYLEMTAQRGDQLGHVIRLIADERAVPLVFHCAAGKDRTGVVAAITLSVLGVNDDDIAEDYGLSADSTKRWLAWAQVHRPEIAATVSGLPGPWTTSPPGAIRMFLADLRAEYGSVEAYLRGSGVGDSTLEALRSHLLTD